MRLRAIFCSLWFGILPYRCYEDKCHYAGTTYGRHLTLNLETAAYWLLFQEPEDWREFERQINPSWRAVWKDMWRKVR